MANNPNMLAGLSAISPTVSAYQNFVEQKDKVNDANIVPFLVSRGEPQLAGLIAKKLRIENVAKTQQQMAQQPPAAPPTVAQQYDAMLAQQQAPQMAPQMPQPPAAGVAAVPNPAMARGFSGGGIVAFQGGGTSMGAATWDALEESFTKAGPAEQARILQWADRNMPTFSKYIREGGPGRLGGYATKAAKVGAPLAAGLSAYGASKSDPESIQATSRLAQLGMDVDPTSKFKTGLATFMGTVESALPTSLLYDTPLERARERTEKVVVPRESQQGVELTLSEDEMRNANQYRDIVKKFGADSPEAMAFEAEYRRRMPTAQAAPAASADTASADTATAKPPAAAGTRPSSAAKPTTAGTRPSAAPAAPKSIFDIGSAPDLKTMEAEQEAFYERTGTGTHSKALADQNKFIDEEAKRLGGDRKQAEKNFWIMTGASLLGSRSPFFANALGDSIKENYGNLIKDLKDLRKENRELEGMRIQLRRAQEQAIETGRRDTINRFDNLNAQYESKKMKVLEIENSAREKALDRATQIEVARMYSAGRRDEGDYLLDLYRSTTEKGISPQEKAARQQALIEARSALQENLRATSATAYSADQSRAARAEAALAKLRSSNAYVFASPEEQRRMEQRARGQSSMISDYAPQSQNVRNPYASASNDEISRLLGLE